jgi:hypothetical protein
MRVSRFDGQMFRRESLPPMFWMGCVSDWGDVLQVSLPLTRVVAFSFYVWRLDAEGHGRKDKSSHFTSYVNEKDRGRKRAEANLITRSFVWWRIEYHYLFNEGEVLFLPSICLYIGVFIVLWNDDCVGIAMFCTVLALEKCPVYAGEGPVSPQ